MCSDKEPALKRIFITASLHRAFPRHVPDRRSEDRLRQHGKGVPGISLLAVKAQKKLEKEFQSTGAGHSETGQAGEGSAKRTWRRKA
jgi:hypothetical protein